MKRVYVAGAYRAPDVVAIFRNMRRGIALAADVFHAGMAPFCPWLDFHFALLRESPPVEQWLEASMAWMEVCDAMIVQTMNLETSHGAQAEIRRAEELGIPVFYHFTDLQNWKTSEELGEKSGKPEQPGSRK